MKDLITYRVQKNCKKAKNNTLGGFTLEKFQAEKEVLENINKIELMECLGLKDKNGKTIYFGDILLDETNNTLLTPVIEITNEEHTLFFKPLRFLNTISTWDVNLHTAEHLLFWAIFITTRNFLPDYKKKASS